jgi:hypothetical protein
VKTIRIEIDVDDSASMEVLSRIATSGLLGIANSWGHHEGLLLTRRAFYSRGLSFRSLKFWPLKGLDQKFLTEREECELTQVA